MSSAGGVEKQSENCSPELYETILDTLTDRGFTRGKSEIIKEGDKKIRVYPFVSNTASAICPHCGYVSDKVKDVANHSFLIVPEGNMTTRVVVTKRRFKCLNPKCTCGSFTESVQGIKPYMARSPALTSTTLLLSVSSSYREASRVLKSIGFKVSPNTIRADCNKIVILDDPDIEKIGIDDVSLRKGHRFCTVIYNLETGAMVKLIEGRSNDEIRDWLIAHEKIKVIARDRQSSYGTVIEKAKPNCELIEVADRFHLIENLFKYLKGLLQTQMSMKITINDGVIKNKGGDIINAKAGTDVPKGKHEFHCKKILCHILTMDPKKKDKTRYKELEKFMPLLEQAFPIIPTLKKIYSEYYDIIMGDDPDKFDEFIAKYENDPEMGHFCELQKKDTAPIKNAISFDYSSGLVEGKNNKFKVLNRIIYGRACLVNLEKRCYLYFLSLEDRIALIVACLMA